MIRALSIIMVFACTMANARGVKTITYIEQPKGADSLEIHEGILSQHAMKIKYKRNGKKIATIELSEPVMVAQAEQEEKWGFFQFPNIGKASDGTLIVSWHMKEDSHKAYGKAGRKYPPMMSKDGGKTWLPQDKTYFAPVRGYNGLMNDGRLLQVITPSSKNVNEYRSFPKPVASFDGKAFYKVDELPQDLQGTYLQFAGENQKPQTIHATLQDPGLVRNTIGELMPLVWWGNIIQIADNSLIAGVYPSRYLNEDGSLTRSSVSFYRSENLGQSWKILSRIPCEADGILDNRGDNEFDEPTFEVLPDSTFMCVMRSGSTSPMYRTFSTNRGKIWTIPEPFTPNGVNPKLLLLKNGVLVLASGRPGVQLRFSFDGNGKIWSEPIEMMPFRDSQGKFDTSGVSCSYASVLPADDSTFYIVYSDFKSKNNKGEFRKAIMFRKIEIDKVNE